MTIPENTAAPIVIYQSADGSITAEVKVQDETVWLTQAQMVALFGKTKQNISLHIRNIFKEGELREMSVVKESLTTAADGKQYKTQLYNLDVIISVGYRVKSSQGTQFRIWANRVLKDYLMQGYALNRQRLEAQQENIQQLERTLTLFQQNLIEQASLPEARGLVSVIAGYTRTFVLLNQFDSERLTMGADVKGDIYEGLLERNAEDTKSGAGQYFTPRALIRAMVECVRPEPGKTIADPACGTGGFFLAAYDFLVGAHPLDKLQKTFLKHETFYGNEIVAGTRRLALMNMFLHNIGEIDGDSMVSPNDALVASSTTTFDYVLANPPFGKKSAMSFTNEAGEQEKDDLTYNRQDFWATTSNKQLNFVQHIRTMLKTTGRAAVVVPDNVLFEGGAGETVRKKLLETTELHTILRLPTGIFYANGVKANVLFFDNREASKTPWTKEVWYYDYRTNIHHTLKKKPLRFEDLQKFIANYNPLNRHERKETWDEAKNPEGRWRKFSYEQVMARDKTSLDIFWLKDKSLADLDKLPEPDELAGEIIENLEAGLNSFREIAAALA